MTDVLPTPIEETTVPTPDAPLVLPFTDHRCQDVELTGGKGASLATIK
jgi:pyruvate,water dikinase